MGCGAMYTTAIIDDVPADAEELCDLLRACPRGVELAIELYASAEDFEAAAAQGALPDVVFMDIRLDAADGRTGIDMVERLLAGSGAQVVYVSAYDACHTQVYRTQHACYLQKPFRRQDVAEALGLVLARVGADAERPLRLRANGAERVVRPRDIRYVESDLRRVRVHLRDGVLESYGKLSDLERVLPRRFVRCHQSFLVNLDYVESLETSDVRLTGGETVPVSRRHRVEVREALFAHIRAGR